MGWIMDDNFLVTILSMDACALDKNVDIIHHNKVYVMLRPSADFLEGEIFTYECKLILK
jgi:hypothetical protein